MEAVTRLGDGPHEPPGRTHDGPSFGRFISLSVLEFADSPGAMEYDIHLCSDNEADPIMTREELVQLSRDALAGAVWLEAHPGRCGWHEHRDPLGIE